MVTKIGFFSKILISFLLIGILPLIILGSLYYAFSSNIIRTMYADQALAALETMAEGIDAMIAEYGGIADELSTDPLLLEAVTVNPGSGSGLSSRVYQRIYGAMSGRMYRSALYLTGANGGPVYSTRPLPRIYDTAAFGSWGVFGRMLERPDRPAVYLQSHEVEIGAAARLSIGMPLSAPVEPDDAIRPGRQLQPDYPGAVGFVVIDVFREAFLEIFSRTGAHLFSELVVTDRNFFTAVNTGAPETEGKFEEPPHRSVLEGGSGVLLDRGSILAFTRAAEGAIVLYGRLPLAPLLNNLDTLEALTAWLSSLSLVICIVLSYLISRGISNPVRTLVRAMERVERGDLTVRLSTDRRDEIGLLFEGFTAMTCRIGRLMEDTLEEHRRLRIAEIKALQAQINPHFLYNTLNSIKSIAKLRHVDEIAAIVTHLGRLLRNNIENDREMSTVGESAALVESYLEIQRIRYRDKFSVRLEIGDDVRDCVLPKLILQPLVENAVVHGLESRIGGGEVTVRAVRSGDSVLLEVRDDGEGMPPGRLEALRAVVSEADDSATETDPGSAGAGRGTAGEDARPATPGADGSGRGYGPGIGTGGTGPSAASAGRPQPDDGVARGSVGFANVVKRLALIYGGASSVEIESAPGEGTAIRIRVPYRVDGTDGAKGGAS